MTSIQEAAGHCVDNASPPSGVQPKYVCKADGSWDLLSGGCQCNPGYRADGQRCVGKKFYRLQKFLPTVFCPFVDFFGKFFLSVCRLFAVDFLRQSFCPFDGKLS